MWTILDEFLDALYPRLCHLCGEPAVDALGCAPHAWPGTVHNPPRCGPCAAPLAHGLPEGFPCPSCRSNAPPFWRTVTCASYRGGHREGGVRPWVLALKHSGRRDLASPLGDRLAGRLQEAEGETLTTDSVLVPVPLHPLRRLERGYDQAALLARAAGRRLGWPVIHALTRSRMTPPQGGLGSPSRRANVHGAFTLEPLAARRLRGRQAWVVDDVMTSGATAAETVRVLRRAGCTRVGVLCLARATGALSSVR